MKALEFPGDCYFSGNLSKLAKPTEVSRSGPSLHRLTECPFPDRKFGESNW